MAALKFPKAVIIRVLEVSKMENSPLFDGIREEWEARGIEKGIEKGRGEGIIEAILEALVENTGQRPAGLQESLSIVQDRDLLKKILRRAIKTKSLDDFEASIKDLMPN